MWRIFPPAALLLWVIGVDPITLAAEPLVNPDGVVTSGADTISPDEPQTQPADAFFAIPTRIDRIGRIVVPVVVNCRGPFQFVLDTGANATVLSPHLAAALKLKVDPTQTMMMRGVTGSAAVPTAAIDRLETGETLLAAQRLAVADASVVGTDGVLGVDSFKNKVVLVDFMHDRVSVLDAREHRPSPVLVRIPAKMQFGRLLMIDALVGTHKIEAIVDTGAQRTLGNLALYRKLGLRPVQQYRESAVEVIGATEARQAGERYVVREVAMGDLRITNLTVTFGNFYIFKIWDLESQPALVIGMDMVGTLDTFGIDYLRREVQIKIARPGSRPRRARPAEPVPAAVADCPDPISLVSHENAIPPR